MKNILLFLLFSSILFGQEKATLSGFVRDRTNKETLPYATVSIKQLRIGTSTNIEGYYAIPNIPEGTFEVTVSVLGYQTATFTINTSASKKIVQDITLSDKAVQVTEVALPAGPGFAGLVFHWQAATFSAGGAAFGGNRTSLVLQ